MTSTLAELRERLNEQLGVTDAEPKPWGTPAQRNSAIRFAFEQLEPAMMRLIEESVTPLADTQVYPLTSRITKVVLVEVTPSGGATRDIKNYRSWTVDGVTSVNFAATPAIGDTIKVTGYAPYVSDLTADTDTSDIPTEEEWIPLLGALAELYRRRFHDWLDFERYNASNPTTVVDPDVLYRAYTDAMARFEQAKADHTRKVATSRRAKFERG